MITTEPDPKLPNEHPALARSLFELRIMSKRPANWDKDRPPSKKNSPPGPRQPHWFEQGGYLDPKNPYLAIPASIRKISRDLWGIHNDDDGGSRSEVTNEEIEWMAAQRPLLYDPRRLTRDYGAQEAALMGSAIRAVGMPEDTAGALAWPGVGTRWSRFMAW